MTPLPGVLEGPLRFVIIKSSSLSAILDEVEAVVKTES